uniref:Uncharacterized protein n=1 Tax=Anguilla anguilla TaxID=7936 RepID=A0A0E9QT48_ANGAN
MMGHDVTSCKRAHCFGYIYCACSSCYNSAVRVQIQRSGLGGVNPLHYTEALDTPYGSK